MSCVTVTVYHTSSFFSDHGCAACALLFAALGCRYAREPAAGCGGAGGPGRRGAAEVRAVATREPAVEADAAGRHRRVPQALAGALAEDAAGAALQHVQAVFGWDV